MAKRLHQLFPALYPVPAVLLTCADLDGTPNVMAVSWIGIASSTPPQLAVSLRPHRLSTAIIRRTGEFVVNCPTEELVLAVDHCGMVSGRKEDKLPATGLTPEPASRVKAPLLRECPISLECRVVQAVSLPSHELFIGEILAVQVDEGILTADGLIDYGRARPIAFLGNEYHRIGECLGTAGLSLHETWPATRPESEE